MLVEKQPVLRVVCAMVCVRQCWHGMISRHGGVCGAKSGVCILMSTAQ